MRTPLGLIIVMVASAMVLLGIAADIASASEVVGVILTKHLREAILRNGFVPLLIAQEAENNDLARSGLPANRAR